MNIKRKTISLIAICACGFSYAAADSRDDQTWEDQAYQNINPEFLDLEDAGESAKVLSEVMRQKTETSKDTLPKGVLPKNCDRISQLVLCIYLVESMSLDERNEERSEKAEEAMRGGKKYVEILKWIGRQFMSKWKKGASSRISDYPEYDHFEFAEEIVESIRKYLRTVNNRSAEVNYDNILDILLKAYSKEVFPSPSLFSLHRKRQTSIALKDVGIENYNLVNGYFSS